MTDPRILKLWREIMGVFSAFVWVQAAACGYLVIKYRAWEMWPMPLIFALIALYFTLRSRGWMEPSN